MTPRPPSPFGPVRAGLVTPLPLSALARFDLAASLWAACAEVLDRPYLTDRTRASVADLARAVDTWHRDGGAA